MNRFAMIAPFLLLAFPSLGDAQEYEPDFELPESAELIVVYIATSNCVGNLYPRLDSAIHQMKIVLSKRAEASGIGFGAIGVAAQWSVEDGLAYLLEGESNAGKKDFGAWDEVHAGRNWINASAINYIWREIQGRPAVPQVVVLERTILTGSRIEVGPDQFLARYVGSEEIVAWVDNAMPLSNSAYLVSGQSETDAQPVR